MNDVNDVKTIHDAFDKLNNVISRLIAPDGCPWDKEQTPESLTEYFVEEAHELVEAIRSGSNADICSEMGDVAFLLILISRLSEKRGGASLADALSGNADKMIRRHPHVFGNAEYTSRDAQLKDWERIKREEKEQNTAVQPEGLYSSLPRSLPPLTKAYRIHSKAARVGFTWTEDTEVEQQVEAEWLELLEAFAEKDAEAIEHEFGDHLFSLVELGRRHNIKAAAALDAANRRFLDRFAAMEKLARERNLSFPDLALDEKDELWNQVKAAEQKKHDTAMPEGAEDAQKRS